LNLIIMSIEDPLDVAYVMVWNLTHGKSWTNITEKITPLLLYRMLSFPLYR
jgi:hypothetical protein